MIIRIFKAQIPTELQNEFEIKFKEISVPLVESFQGLLSIEIGKPSQWNPNQYVMITHWDNEESLKVFAGEKWNEAHIPEGMEKYISSCTVDHYYQIEIEA